MPERGRQNNRPRVSPAAPRPRRKSGPGSALTAGPPAAILTGRMFPATPGRRRPGRRRRRAETCPRGAHSC